MAARVWSQHKEKSGQPNALLTLLVGLLAALAVERDQQAMLLRARTAELAAALICRGRGFTLPPTTPAPLLVSRSRLPNQLLAFIPDKGRPALSTQGRPRPDLL